MRIKYVNLQKCYLVKLGEALPWRYPASCSSGKTPGGASLKWAKAQQSCCFAAPSTHTDAGSLGLRSPAVCLVRL
jgi:hypothetical protein